jgi:hypothetical protein
MDFRSLSEISEVDINGRMTWKARSEKERSFHDIYSLLTSGMVSGWKRPPSDANPFKTTSSKEKYC